MLPYGRQSISDEDVEAVAAILRGDWLTTGPTVAAFENAVSELPGGHRAVSCTSGTAALHMAYAGLGIGPGRSSISAPASASSPRSRPGSGTMWSRSTRPGRCSSRIAYQTCVPPTALRSGNEVDRKYVMHWLEAIASPDSLDARLVRLRGDH